MERTPLQGHEENCCTPSERKVLGVAEAQRRVLGAISPLAFHESVSLKDGLARVIAETVYSACDVPPWDNSAMDGYALSGMDLPSKGQRTLQVIGTAMAGAPFAGEVAAGQCVRIMTGGVVPRGCDTVVMQEQAERRGDSVLIGAGQTPGQHVRRAGEDIAAGQAVLKAGKRITPADLGLLSALGIARVTVMRRPRVAYFSTGDELRNSGETLAEGQIYDSNRHTLYGMLLQTGAVPLDLGVIRDDLSSLQDALASAAAQADAVVTSGGVSAGAADLVRTAVAALGTVHFWKIGMRPGRPFTFGRIGQTWFFGLPGNPVSTMVTYYQLVQPALRQLTGELAHPPAQFKVPSVTALKKAPGRMEFQRGILEINAAGETVVRTTGAQGSNILRSMSEADCFIVLPAEWGDVPAGTMVNVQPFTSM